MIKSILVHIPTERPIRPVIDASISLAQRFGAALDALSLGYISTSAAFVVEGAAATVLAANLDIEERRAAERTAAALAVFDVAARNASVPYRSRSIEGIPADAADAIGAAARLHDLSVVLQPDVDHYTFDNTISRDILLQSGGPVLFVPYIFNGPFQPKRIGICWDGSRLASRALRDAHPFLARANYLCALSIDASDTAPAEASLEKLREYLTRYGQPHKSPRYAGRGHRYSTIDPVAGSRRKSRHAGARSLREFGPAGRHFRRSYARDDADHDLADTNVALKGRRYNNASIVDDSSKRMP
jgi:hypothetical protein